MCPRPLVTWSHWHCIHCYSSQKYLPMKVYKCTILFWIKHQSHPHPHLQPCPVFNPSLAKHYVSIAEWTMLQIKWQWQIVLYLIAVLYHSVFNLLASEQPSTSPSIICTLWVSSCLLTPVQFSILRNRTTWAWKNKIIWLSMVVFSHTWLFTRLWK